MVGQALATAACGGFNSGYFCLLWLRGNGSPARRLGAAALILVNGAIVVESLFAQAVYWAYATTGSLDALATPQSWLAAHVPLLAAAILITFLIAGRPRMP